MTKVLKLALLGPVIVSREEKLLTDLVSAKAHALLYYLAVTAVPHSRPALANLLWGGLPEADARRNLRGALLKLRQFVEPNLLINNQTLSFNQESAYWLDVTEFQASLSRRSGGRPLAQPPSPSQLRQAIDLYRGEFLQGFYVRQAPEFEDWVTRQQTQLQDLFLNACYALAVHYTETGEFEAGIDHARRLLALDPVREDGHRQLMLLLARHGQRSAALNPV